MRMKSIFKTLMEYKLSRKFMDIHCFYHFSMSQRCKKQKKQKRKQREKAETETKLLEFALVCQPTAFDGSLETGIQNLLLLYVSSW